MAFLIREGLLGPEESRMRRRLRQVLPLLLCGCTWLYCLSVSAEREDVPPVEYQVKASLIFNFLQYIDWPPETSQESQLRICIAGPDRFGVALRPLEREVVRGKSLEIAHMLSPAAEEVKRCQVVFFSAESPSLKVLLGQLKGTGVLTIGETNDFLSNGGIINLQLDGNKVVFDINREAAVASRIEISSKLLRIARHVGES